MLSVTALYSRGEIVGIIAEGHSGYSDRGSDIVCSSVSTLVQALWLGLEKVVCVECLEANAEPSIPCISLCWRVATSETNILAETTLMSIEMVADEYPKFVKVSKKNL